MQRTCWVAGLLTLVTAVAAPSQDGDRGLGPAGRLRDARDQLRQAVKQGGQDIDRAKSSGTGSEPAEYWNTPINATLPANTVLMVRLQEDLSSRNAPGSAFSATLETDLVADGVLVAPKGSQVFGQVSAQSQRARNVVGQSRLDLTLTGITVKNVLHPVMTTSFQQTGDREGLKTARTVGVGAIIGQASEKKGEKPNREASHIGTAAGLGAAALRKGDDTELAAGTVLQFQLTMPLVINESPAPTPSD